MVKRRLCSWVLVMASVIGLALSTAGTADAWGWGRGYYGWGWGYPYYGWGGYGWGGWGWRYPSYWGGGGYAYSYYPAYYSVPVYAPVYTYAATPTQSYYYSPLTVPADRAMLRVQVPTSDADVWIEGKRMSTTGQVREYESPPLGGGNYQYTVRARWQQNGRPHDETKTIQVRSGQESSMTFGF